MLHGLIKKVTKTHRYQLTDYGRSAITALLARQTSRYDEAYRSGVNKSSRRATNSNVCGTEGVPLQ